MDYSRPELVDRLAAAYTAGTLRGPARRRLVSLMRSHAGLRTAVREWEARLMPLTASIAPVPPPPRVWKAIESRIAPNQAVKLVPKWWSQLAVWRAISGVATMAALTLAVLLAIPQPSQPPIIVVLTPAGGTAPEGGVVPASFVASISADGRAMVTKPLSTVSLQADRALELWAVPAQGAPRSLGVISEKSATVVKRGRVLDNTAALAVTLEPPGGSPTGAPTGPILYLGKLVL